MIKITDDIYTEEYEIKRVFGSFFDNIENISQSEFDNCINHAKEKKWENWQSAFERWKEKGMIPFETIE